MTVNTTWIDPTSATLDKTTDDVYTETVHDGILSDINVLGGSTGRRPAVRREWLKGADVASAATVALGTDGNLFDITGTTEITSITILAAGTVVMLQFDGALKVTDGGNLLLQGDFYTAAGSALVLVSDGTNWIELSRSHGAANSGSNDVGGDVAMPSANTFYDGPSLSLGAGTWLLMGYVTVLSPVGGSRVYTAKLWDGTTSVAGIEDTVAASEARTLGGIAGIVTPTGTTTYKISVAANGIDGTIRAANTSNSPGNLASGLRAVRAR